MKKETILQIITGILAALFFYAAFSKLIDYEKSHTEMRNQVFSSPIADILTWLIPVTELMLVIGLLFSQTRKKALWASTLLLSSFTIYIGIIMTGAFGFIPCSCGGILRNMDHSTHIVFNIFFIALSILGLAMENNWKIINRWFNYKTERSLPKIE